MTEPICYVVKSTEAHYWFSVERGCWVERSDVTRFLSRSTAFDVAKMIRGRERGPVTHRIYVAAVRKRVHKCPFDGRKCKAHGFVHGREAEELRVGIERLLDRGCLNYPLRLRELLDEVDARDSLAFVECISQPSGDEREPKR